MSTDCAGISLPYCSCNIQRDKIFVFAMPKSKSKITQRKSSTSPHPAPSENMSDSEDLEVDIPGEDYDEVSEAELISIASFCKMSSSAAVG